MRAIDRTGYAEERMVYKDPDISIRSTKSYATMT